MKQGNPLADTLIALSGQRGVITVHKSFVKFTGSLEAAMLLSQLLYWTPRATLHDNWIAKSSKEFEDELSLSGYRIRQAKSVLAEMGILKTKLKRFAGSPTVHYRIDLDALSSKWKEWLLQMDFVKMQNPNNKNGKTCTETTTETTTQSTCASKKAKQEAADKAVFDAEFGKPQVKGAPAPTKPWQEKVHEPWHAWGVQSQALGPRNDVSVEEIQKVGYMLEVEFGMAPVWADRKKTSYWFSQCADLYVAADGDYKLIHQVTRQGIKDGLMLSQPRSMFNLVRARVAERNRGPALGEGEVLPGGHRWVNVTTRKEVDGADIPII